MWLFIRAIVRRFKLPFGAMDPQQEFLQMPNVEGVIEPGKKKAKKTIDIELHGIWGRGVISPLKPEVFTPSGKPASATPVLRLLAGKPGAAKRALAELDGSVIATDGMRAPGHDGHANDSLLADLPLH